MKLRFFAKALIMPILITSFFLFYGCSEDLTSIISWSADDDLPTLYGMVVDANTNSPMDSVMVSWIDNRDSLGVATVYTDKNGYYSIEDLNYGAYTFTVYKDSTYATVISTKTILTVSVGDGSATEAGLVDDYRYENNVSMYPLNAGVSGTVNKIVNDATSPADTVTVTITLNSMFFPSEYTTTTDSIGRYSFANLPATGLNVTITVLPHNDGTNDFASTTTNLILISGATLANQDISVTENEGTVYGIVSIYTNLNDYDINEFPVASDIKILFSETPSITNINTSVVLTDEDAPDDPAVAIVLSVSGDTLIINPDGNLRNDINYEVTYTVYTSGGVDADGDGTCDAGDSCTSSDPDFKTVRGYTAVPGAVTFSMDTATMKLAGVINAAGNFAADFDDTDYSFSWPTVDNADKYYIYAKDNLNNPNYVRVLDVDDQDDETIQTENVTLPSQFDRLSDDAGTFGQTPLAGITVSFVITAYNDYGEGTMSNTITITDTDEPEAPATANTSCNNTSATETLTCTVTHTYTEIMDVSITPTATITGTLSSATVTHEWDDDGNVGTFTITVPASTNGTGDTFTVDKSTVKDLSGNVLSSDWSETL